ncbi:hypothetical protein BHE90_009827 [Fusarium euwallaceae]|uniref:Nephrocystin 3-like N-terminal domain-containing protein n=1 Tax=Fusarium euwallaceae TaxID=1147111 RepID=A0A430LJ64_9HYPO|nr:hypothetical protein BHE90_009827 [Fusarium euwallaceae]
MDIIGAVFAAFAVLAPSTMQAASAIIGMVDFGTRVLSTTEIYQSASDPTTRDVELSNLSDELDRLTKKLIDILQAASSAASASDSTLQGLLVRCIEASNKLHAAIRDLQANWSGDGRISTTANSFASALKTLWKQGEIESLKKELTEIHAQTTFFAIISVLLESKRYDQEGMELKQRVDQITEKLDSYDDTVRRFAGRLEQIRVPNNSNLICFRRQDLIDLLWGVDVGSPVGKLLIALPATHTHVDGVPIPMMILKSLSFREINRRKEAIHEASANTCSWILRDSETDENGKLLGWPSFPTWLKQGDENIYWITGKPGSGKSTLMKYIIENPDLRTHLQEYGGDLPCLQASFLSRNLGCKLETSREGLLRTVLHQCLEARPELIPTVAPRRWVLYSLLGDRAVPPEWAWKELKESFDSLCSLHGRHFRLALFIDGLDGFQEPGQAPDLPISLIHDTATRYGIKICVSSRPWNVFVDAFGQGPCLQIRNLSTVAFAHTSSHPVPPSDSGYGSALTAGKSPLILATSYENRSLSNAALGAFVEEQEDETGTSDTSNTMDDGNTVYTDNLTLSDVRLESYMLALVDDLSQKVGSLFQCPEVVEELAVALPRVLKAFSCKLGHTGSSKMHQDTMVFIHKYRQIMADMFRERYADAMEAQQNPPCLHRGRDSPVMLDRWIASSDDPNYEHHLEEGPGAPPRDGFEEAPEDELEEDGELSVPGLEEYKHIIYTAPSYQWVLGQLRREILLSKPKKSNKMDAIRGRILAAMPGKRHVSSKKASQAVDVTYTVDCDLLAFLRGQEYDEPADVAIAQAVTLTGSQADAQASSCQQYLDQTWPCTGPQTLMLIQKMLRNPDYDAQVFVSEPSACRLAASFNGGKLTISATGIPEFVAEIGEQIAWMGAALQLSPYANKTVTECTPFVDDIRPIEGVLHCHIKFDFQPCQEQSGAVNGYCWHDMFRNAVIVRGFPILRRSESNTGLEMPLSLMALLTRTRYVEEFGWKMYIKGFSTMLVPTKRSDGMIYWHLLFNKNPEDRISYLDCSIEHAMVQKADLETSRHVLGTLMADYSISRSQLPRTHSSCALDKVEIHAGQLVTGTACFSIGNREKPVHISRHGYFTKLQWISSKWIVFWDEGEKRGWLVNGASALLHILRSSLTHSKSKFKSAFLMNPQDLPDPESVMEADAALQILTEEKNRSIPLYRENVEFENCNTDLGKGKGPETQFRYYRLENRVDHIYNMLEKLIDHQTDAERRNGLRIKPRPRRHLEGWDFKDLVTDGDPFFARVATLNALGKGWVDFIRSIHAVTLLGRGFGELIQPKQTSNGGCSRWLTLPTERYYLAARVSDLKEIMEDHGDAQANPMKLCDDVLWPVKNAAFQSCPCGTTTQSLKHYEPVQTLFPMSFKHLLVKKPLVELKETGAVVFGHNINIHWYWKDFDDPVKGDPPEEGVSLESFEDSGLGSTLGSCESPSGYDTSHAPTSASHAVSTGASDPSGVWADGDQDVFDTARPSRSGSGRVQGVISSISTKVKPLRWWRTKRGVE